MDFTVDQGVLNFINPPPPKLPALEEINNERFSIPQLKCFIEELETLQKLNNGNQNLPVRELSSLFNVRKNCSKTFRGISSGIPEKWQDMSMYDFQAIIRNLDP